MHPNPKIVPQGSYLPLDQHGAIQNITSLTKVQPEYKNALDTIIEFLTQVLNLNLYAVFLRGSLAKGEAIPFVSDIDCIVFVNTAITELQTKAIQSFTASFLNNHSFVTGLELPVEVYKDSLPSVYQFVIKTQAVCIHGTDFSKEIPTMYLKDGYIALPKIQNFIHLVHQELENSTTEQDTQEICTWAMKRILRALFELHMEEAMLYTRDLYRCYETALIFYPHQKELLDQLLDLAIFPTTHQPTIKNVLNTSSVLFNN
jgi:uncharacterized protein